MVSCLALRLNVKRNNVSLWGRGTELGRNLCTQTQTWTNSRKEIMTVSCVFKSQDCGHVWKQFSQNKIDHQLTQTEAPHILAKIQNLTDNGLDHIPTHPSIPPSKHGCLVGRVPYSTQLTTAGLFGLYPCILWYVIVMLWSNKKQKHQHPTPNQSLWPACHLLHGGKHEHVRVWYGWRSQRQRKNKHEQGKRKETK